MALACQSSVEIIIISGTSADGAATNPIEPSRSVVQGLRSDTRFARILTHFVMHKVTQASPHMGHRLWVDDISQKVVGSRQEVVHSLIICIVNTCRELADQKLKGSPKSVVLCTHKEDAVEI
eukprot:8123157-Pyramimonas_sp.AAC.1